MNKKSTDGGRERARIYKEMLREIEMRMGAFIPIMDSAQWYGGYVGPLKKALFTICHQAERSGGGNKTNNKFNRSVMEKNIEKNFDSATSLLNGYKMADKYRKKP